MNRKSHLLIYTFFISVVVFSTEILYLFMHKGAKEDELLVKKEFVKSVGIPDLAIATEASYIRHRSLSDFFSIYRDDGALREYFASTFVFNEPNTQE